MEAVFICILLIFLGLGLVGAVVAFFYSSNGDWWDKL